MKRIVPIFIAASLFAGCGNQDSPEALKAKLSKLKEQSTNINHQIKLIESRLAEIDTLNNGSNRISVIAERVKSEPFNHYFIASGKVELENQAAISTETNGQVKKIYVRKGERVKKGDILIALNTSIIENSISEVKIGLELATKVYEKQKALWEQNIGTELQYLQAKNQKESLEQKLKTLNAQLDMSIVKAPFDGIVDDIYIKEGELASPGKPVAYLLNPDKIKIEADISESFLSKVHVGDKIAVTFPTFPDIKIETEISRIGNYIDPKTRTITIQVNSNNPSGMIKPNQIALLYINDYYNPKAITVPSIILKQDTKGTFLFTVDKASNREVAKKVYVKTGISFNDRTEVVKGLKDGDMVIVAGYNMVSNSIPVNVSIR
ncbi:efflux RND transporter periplasmic adaptor subunit [Tenuifilum thalassicum]|uniref:Efflux RND transporter periplasmic adaptor subunit n=1 Tax=Tenuifilum thalassicum TaxID=2590900 RepID=A0A7D4BDF9_9BACT|nr:efflux RND transporter periplasmic adaptor subunit [Tenuifilum thalassicum]QKG79298.1 efflux RND transporter periplasmic adaptor subunit [Tenuifilum thalassicum]